MTTLDDAAEREIRATIHAIIADDSYTDLADAFRACWAKATEAAALKCEAAANDYGLRGGSAEAACLNCADAIRGGKL